MRWLTKRLVNVIESSHWRHGFWRHRHRRLTIVVSVIAVVIVTALFLVDTRLIHDPRSVDFHRSISFRSHPSVSSSSHPSSSSYSPSSMSSSHSSSSSSSSSLSSFFQIFFSHQLLKHRNTSLRTIQHASESSSSSEPHPRSASGASSRSSSGLPPSLEAIDAQSINDTRYPASARATIKYHSCFPSSPTPHPSHAIPSEAHTSSQTSWQRLEVPSSRGQPTVSHLFSAHYDPRSRPRSVIIVGLINTYNENPTAEYFCQFRYRNSSALEATTAIFTYATETHGRRYAASFHTCYLRHDRIPYAVSLVTDRCESSPSNQLPVQFTQLPWQPPKRNFTVCVTPLNKAYNNANQLVEMIEVNRMFGAQRFVFYNHTTGPDVLPYLRSYEDDGLVEVIPWQLPVTADPWPDDPLVVPDVHYYGQLAALNDCLYRNLLVSRFVVFTDLDELIVPRGGHATWAEFLETATRRMLGNSPSEGKTRSSFPGAYVIQNTFFRSDWDDDSRASEDVVVRELGLKTLLKTTRETTVYPWYARSKCIVWTKAAVTVGVHAVSGFVDDRTVVTVRVDAGDALLHHYRLMLWPDDPMHPPRRTTDPHMHRFYEEIRNRTVDRHDRVMRGLHGKDWTAVSR